MSITTDDIVRKLVFDIVNLESEQSPRWADILDLCDQAIARVNEEGLEVHPEVYHFLEDVRSRRQDAIYGARRRTQVLAQLENT